MTAVHQSVTSVQTLAGVENDRSNNFDFLRFVMASLVLSYHCYPLLYGGAAARGGKLEEAASLAAGAAVDFFFVISGFLVTQSWLRTPQAGQFLKKRLLRIYPAFILVSLFCALVIGPLGAANATEYFRSIHPAGFVVYMLLLVGPYLPPVFLHLPFSGQVDGSFWTLRYEFECYLIVMLLGLLGLLRHPAFVLACFLAAALVTLSAILGHPLPIPDRDMHLIGNPIQWCRLALCFLSGMTFLLYRDKIPYSRPLLIIALAGIGLGADFGNWWGLAVPTFGAYLLFWTAFRPVSALAHFAKHGDFSYGVYLFAYPVQQTLICYFQPHLTPSRLLCLAYPMTLLLAVLSWHFVEKPALRFKKGAAQVQRT
ncbi:MAG: acyltransferase family protein [Janthinobacterium lividum]